MTTQQTNFKEPHFGYIPLACVIPSKTNPRKRFDEAYLAELAASIKQHGVAQPILVRPLPTTEEMIDCVEIVAGECRYRASKLAGVETIPAIVRELTDVETLEIQVIENLQRRDVHPIEEAEGYDQLMKLHGYTADQLAEKVGKSRSYIYGRLKFTALADGPRTMFFEGKLSASTALLIARIPNAELQEKATKEIVEPHPGAEPLSYRRAVDLIQARYMLSLHTAPFSLVDAKLVSSAGSCEKCPKRTGNQPELFADVDRADVCTDPDCFAVKRIAHGQKVITQAKKKGIPVYEEDEADDKLDMRSGTIVELTETMLCFDRRDEDIGQYMKLRDVLPQDKRPQPIAYVKNHKGEPEPVFEKTAMQEALEQAGLCHTLEQYNARMQEKLDGADLQASINADAAKKAAQEKQARKAEIAKLETKVRIAAYRRIRTAMEFGFTEEIMRVIVHELRPTLNVPNAALPDVYPWERYSQEKEREFVDKASLEDLQLMILDMVASPLLKVGQYQVEEDGTIDSEDEELEQFLRMAKAADIDLDAVRAEVLAPVAATAPAPTEPAAQPKAKKSKKKVLAPNAAWPFPMGEAA